MKAQKVIINHSNDNYHHYTQSIKSKYTSRKKIDKRKVCNSHKHEIQKNAQQLHLISTLGLAISFIVTFKRKNSTWCAV